MDNLIFTICSKNYLAQAITLGQSVKETNDCDYLIFLCDLFESKEDLIIADKIKNSGFLLETLHDIDILNLEDMAGKYSVLEMNTAVKPFICETLTKRYKKIIYLDPDILVLDSLEDIWSDLDQYNAVLTPHMFQDLPEDKKNPTNLNILVAGVYNLGFIAFNAQTDNILKWWQDKLSKYCFMEPMSGMHVDQNWINVLPVYFDKVKINTSRRHNVAYWNLHERNIELISDTWFANSEKISFFHFSGFNPHNINSISKHQNRFSFKDFPHLAQLYHGYAKKLEKNMLGIFQKKSYFFNKIPGTKINLSKDMRTLSQNFPNNIFNPEYTDTYLAQAKKTNPKEQKTTFGANIWGYFDSCTGVAENARSMFKLAYKTGIPVLASNLGIGPIDKFDIKKIPIIEKNMTLNNIYQTNIMCVNANETDNVMKFYGRQKFSSKYNIGIWFWELEDYFPFPKAADKLNEIWACSSFCAKTFRKFTDKPVIEIPYPFQQGWTDLNDPQKIRHEYGISDDTFIFYYIFDFYSCVERKNPEGAINAFNLFRSQYPNKKTKLILKASNGKFFNYELHRLQKKINENIILINKSLSTNELMSLVNAADCCLSLHRSEGLGLNIMEAMALGKQVIATNYGGITDIMDETNAYPVNYKKTPIQKAFGPYRPGELWTEPDVAHAAELMNLVYTDRNEDKTTKAKIDIQNLLEKAEKTFKKRLVAA